MSVIGKIIAASTEDNQQVFDRLMMRLGYQICPQEANITSALTMVLCHAPTPEEFKRVCQMAWSSKNFSDKHHHGLSSASRLREIDFLARTLFLCISAAFHNDKMELIPDLFEIFVDRFSSRVDFAASELKTKLVGAWMSQEKFLDWENHIDLYERISANAHQCDTHVLHQASQCGSLSVVKMLYISGKVPPNRLPYFPVMRSESLRLNGSTPFSPEVFSDVEREIAKMGGCDPVLQILMDPEAFPNSGFENTEVGKLVKNLKVKADSTDDERPLQALLDLLDVPSLTPPQLEFFQLLRSNAPMERFPYLHAFVSKHELLQEVHPSTHRPASHKLM